MTHDNDESGTYVTDEPNTWNDSRIRNTRDNANTDKNNRTRKQYKRDHRPMTMHVKRQNPKKPTQRSRVPADTRVRDSSKMATIVLISWTKIISHTAFFRRRTRIGNSHKAIAKNCNSPYDIGRQPRANDSEVDAEHLKEKNKKKHKLPNMRLSRINAYDQVGHHAKLNGRNALLGFYHR